jgi:hypothetical protein
MNEANVRGDLTRGYPAEKARGGEIILRKRWQRWVFALGLAAPVLLFLELLFYRP